jgi:hypothetical protein
MSSNGNKQDPTLYHQYCQVQRVKENILWTCINLVDACDPKMVDEIFAEFRVKEVIADFEKTYIIN